MCTIHLFSYKKQSIRIFFGFLHYLCNHKVHLFLFLHLNHANPVSWMYLIKQLIVFTVYPLEVDIQGGSLNGK